VTWLINSFTFGHMPSKNGTTETSTHSDGENKVASIMLMGSGGKKRT